MKYSGEKKEGRREESTTGLRFMKAAGKKKKRNYAWLDSLYRKFFLRFISFAAARLSTSEMQDTPDCTRGLLYVGWGCSIEKPRNNKASHNHTVPKFCRMAVRVLGTSGESCSVPSAAGPRHSNFLCAGSEPTPSVAGSEWVVGLWAVLHSDASCGFVS